MTRLTLQNMSDDRSHSQQGLFLLLLSLPVGVFILFCSSADGTARALIAASMVLPALVLAAIRSSYLLDYFLIIVAFNREVRRLMDWMADDYDRTPLTSVTPMAIACLMLAVALSRFTSWPVHLRRGTLLIAAGLGYSMLLGLEYRLGAVYGLLDYLMPLSVLCFCASMRPSEAVITRWLRTFVTLAVMVSIYGVVQWTLVPPWDKAWVMWSGMWSSMGMPEPFKMGIASTLESRGPAAWFIANAAVFMIAASRFRKPWGLVGTAFVCGVLLLTTVRSSWGFVILAVVLYTMLQCGRTLRQLWVLGVAVAGMVICIPFLPEAERIQSRVLTISSLRTDGSFQGRLRIAKEGVNAVLAKPQGFGMGSSGNGGRLVEGGLDGIGDNGYLSLLADLGVPGFALFVAGLTVIVVPVWKLHRSGKGSPVASIGLAMFGSSTVLLLIFNTFTSAHASYMWIAIAAAYPALHANRGANWRAVNASLPVLYPVPRRQH